MASRIVIFRGTLPAQLELPLLVASATLFEPGVVPVWTLERLAPDAILEQTNCTGAVTDIDEDPDSADAAWVTATSNNVGTVLRTSFPTPAEPLVVGAGLQEFRYWVRKQGGTGNPTVTPQLYENNTLIRAGSAQTITSATGELFTFTWNANEITTVANVECRLVGTQTGGAGGVRASVDVGAVEWNATTLTPLPVSLPLLAASAVLFTPEVEVSTALNISLPLLVAGATLNAPEIELNVALPLLSASATLNAPSLALNASPPLLSAGATLFSPALSLNVTAPLLAASATVYNPTAAPGAVDVSLPLLTANATVFGPSVTLAVALPLLNASATLNGPSLQLTVSLPLLTANATLFDPTVSSGVTISLPLLVANATVHAPEVELNVALPLLSAPATLYSFHIEPARPLGFNMDFVYDDQCWTFANKFRQAAAFHSGTSTVWDDGRTLTVDANGYPTSLLTGPDQQAITLFSTHLRQTQYELTWDGNGTIQLSDILSIDQNGPGNYVLFTSNANNARGQLRITAVGSPHITNIQIRRVGETEPDFDSTFLANFANVKCVRFMQWMLTNEVGGSTNDTTWSQRHQPNWFFQTGRVAWERCIELVNRLQCDAWINIPVRADNDYCRQLGALWAANLDPNLRVRLELSNEVWNGAFGQWSYAVAQGQAQGLDDDQPGGVDAFVAAMRWLGRRSVQTFREFEYGWNGGSYGRNDRIVRQVAGQIGFSYEFARIFEGVDLEGDPATEMDAVAVNPYVGAYLYAEPVYLETSSVQTILRRLRSDFWAVGSPPLAQEMSTSKTIANTYNCELVAYEGGQHLAVYGADQNNVPLINNLIACNRDPEMESVYQLLLNHWTSIGGGLFCHYTYTGAYGAFGTWGALENSDETGTTADKYRALQDWSALSGVIVGPTTLIASATLFGPTVQTSGQSVILPLLSANATLFSPTAAPGAVDVSLPLLSASATLFSPTVSTGSSSITIPTLVASAVLFPPTLSGSTQTINMPLLVAGAVLVGPHADRPDRTTRLPVEADRDSSLRPTTYRGISASYTVVMSRSTRLYTFI